MRIEFGGNWIEVDRDGLSSNLKEISAEDVSIVGNGDEYCAAIDGMESFLLTMVSHGLIHEENIHLFTSAIEETVEHISNNTL